MIRFDEDDGNRGTYRIFADIDGRSKRAIRQAWFAFGKDLKSTANRMILDKSGKTGRVYLVRSGRSGRRRRHRASAPGETHANLRGRLRRSIGWKVSGVESMAFGYGASLRDTPRYAPFVERGTRRMDPRPSLQNAVDEEEGTSVGHFERYLSKEFE